ncbi:MAG: HAD family hydrolase [Candidatus Thermoplasmatota archaeon]
MIKQPEAILFDMDGVLVDSLDSWWLSLNSAMKMYTDNEITREEFIKTYWGHDLRDNLRKAGLDQRIVQFCNMIYSDYLYAVRLYPDTKPTLKKLQGYRKGVITNTPRDCALKILNKFDIDYYFDVVLTSDEVTKGKPDPEIIYKACSNLNIEPTNVLVVGDTINDVKAGKAAGCTVVGINIDADITIKNLSELPDILQKIF